jgi:hypothetical protein
MSAEERRRRKLYSWQRVALEYDTVPSGRLRLELTHGEQSWREWADTKRSTLEGKLREVVRAAEQRALADEQAQLEAQQRHEELLAELDREEAAKRARWEAAMTQARTRAIAAHRDSAFGKALDLWESAGEIREFCAALDQAASSAADPELATRLRTWIDWGLALAERLDPARNPAQLADAAFDVDPADDDLRPYLGEWSPRGPYTDYRPRRDDPPQAPMLSDIPREGWWYGRRGRAQWWRR